MEEEDGHGQQHPLENPVVLDVLFGYLRDSNILVNARQVCRAWRYQAGLSEWNPRRIFQSGGGEDEQQVGNEVDEEEPLSLTTVTATLVQLKGMYDSCHGDDKLLKAYRRFNYVIDGWTVKDDQFGKEGKKGEDLIGLERWFWRDNGANIKIINLYGCEFPKDATVFKLCFLKELPNLEGLKIIKCRFGREACQQIKIIGDHYRRQLYAESRPKYRTDKVKILVVDKLDFEMDGELNVWLPFLEMISGLEEVVVKGMDNSDVDVLVSHVYQQGQRLKKLDIMEYFVNRAAEEMPVFPQIFLGSLEHLTLDIGFKTGRQLVKNLIEIHGYSLKVLHLYRAPFSEPYQDFALILDNLTELHLWGNVAKDLNFLKFLRSLRVLKWNTSCYEDKWGGKRLLGYLAEGDERVIMPLFMDDLVEKTGQDLGGKISERLGTFEVDWGMGVKSWRRLGGWMPNLRRLKAVVRGDKELMEIGERWGAKGLRSFEMGHGSWMESEMGVVAGFSGMEGLEEFVWRGCGCIKERVEKELGEDVRGIVENTLREVVGGGRVILPWRGEGGGRMGGDVDGVCEEGDFLKALLHGR